MSEQDPFDHLNHIADGRILASKDELQALIAESNRKAVEEFVARFTDYHSAYKGPWTGDEWDVICDDLRQALKEPRKEAE